MNQTFSLQQELHLLRHPFYQAWMQGTLSIAALKDYARQYYHHVEAFPSYLLNALGTDVDDASKEILRQNLAEEDGSRYGTPHPELWLRFAEGLGVDRNEVISANFRQGILNVVETFDSQTKSSLAQALGVLYAYEAQVPEIAESKIEGLRRHFNIHDERTLSFFEVHRIADVQHRQSLMEIIEKLSQSDRQLAQKAADSACRVLWNFLSEVYQANGAAGT